MSEVIDGSFLGTDLGQWGNNQEVRDECEGVVDLGIIFFIVMNLLVEVARSIYEQGQGTEVDGSDMWLYLVASMMS